MVMPVQVHAAARVIGPVTLPVPRALPRATHARASRPGTARERSPGPSYNWLLEKVRVSEYRQLVLPTYSRYKASSAPRVVMLSWQPRQLRTSPPDPAHHGHRGPRQKAAQTPRSRVFSLSSEARRIVDPLVRHLRVQPPACQACLFLPLPPMPCSKCACVTKHACKYVCVCLSFCHAYNALHMLYHSLFRASPYGRQVHPRGGTREGPLTTTSNIATPWFRVLA